MFVRYFSSCHHLACVNLFLIFIAVGYWQQLTLQSCRLYMCVMYIIKIVDLAAN